MSLSSLTKKNLGGKELAFRSLNLDLLCCLFLLATSILAMAPVLLHPHWGMFSDPNQIIDMCRRIYANGFDWHYCFQRMWADFRPGFHLLDIALWSVSPNNPWLYYVLRAFFFAMTVILTFANCMVLTRSRLVSVVCAMIWLVAYPTYEVIYTLDKGEVFLGFLFSAVIYLNLKVTGRLLNEPVSKSFIFASAAAAFFAITYAIFTKETGLLLVGYILCVAAYSIFNKVRLPSIGLTDQQSYLHRLTKDPVVRWSSLLFFISALAAASHKVLFLVLGGLTYKYGETVLDPSLLCSQLATYVQAIPELFGLLGLTAVVLVPLFFFSLHQKNADDSFAFTQSFCLLLTTLAGAIAMCSWKYRLIYIWYPLFATLLPCLGYAMLRARNFLPGTHIVVGALLCCLIPARLADAQSQFQMDATFDQTMDEVASLPEKLRRNVDLIVKMKDKASIEIGEEIGAAISDRRAHSIGQAADVKKQELKVYNLIRNASGDLAEDLKLFAEDTVAEPGCKARPGLDKFIFVRDQLPHWRVNNVKVGDLVIVPFGTVPATLIPYRGVLCFAKPIEALPESLPQLALSPLFTIKTRLVNLGHATTEIGWTVLEVKQTPTIALPLGDYGWFANNGEIHFGRDLVGKTLKLQNKVSLVKNILVEQSNRSGNKSIGPHDDSLEIRLTDEAGVLKISAAKPYDQAVLFQVTDVSLR